MISLEEVKHIAKLARLGLADNEAEKMQKELAVILDYIDLLNTADVSGVKTEAHLFQTENITRRDVATEEQAETVEAILSQVPVKQDRHIKVKEVLK